MPNRAGIDSEARITTQGSLSLLDCMVKPLLEELDYQIFHPTVWDTWNALSREQLHNVHEVEVMLLANCPVSLLRYHRLFDLTIASKRQYATDEIYRRYQQKVAALREKALQSTARHLRDQYCAAYIYELQIICLKPNPLLSCVTPADISENPTPDSSPNTCETPSSVLSTDSSSSSNTWASATSSVTLPSPASFRSSKNPSLNAHSIPSPTAGMFSRYSLRQPDTTQPCSTGNVTYCDICNAKFRGKQNNRVSNLNRHLKDIHGLGEGLKCGVSGCDRVFGRSDNRRKHRESVHNIIDPLERPRKRNRSSSGDDTGLAHVAI